MVNSRIKSTCLAKGSETERERQMPYDIAYMWNLKTRTQKKLTTKHRLADRENKLMVTRGEGEWEGINWEFRNRTSWGVMDILAVLIVVEVSLGYTSIKIHQNVHLKCV